MRYLSLPDQGVEFAIEKRAALLKDSISRPLSESSMAVVVSFAMNRCIVSPDEAKALHKEGMAILDTCRAEGKNVTDVFAPTRGDIDALLRDPSITDLCLIGEGALGCFYVLGEADKPATGGAYDWHDVATTSDHLKTGNIFQRMCSVARLSPVAWGTFASANLPMVWVSEEPLFNPTEVHDRPETGLMQIYDDNTLSHEVLRAIQAGIVHRQYAPAKA